MSESLFVGLMSGTSGDGVDAVLLEVTPGAAGQEGSRPTVRFGGSLAHPFDAELRTRLLRVAAGDAGTREVALVRRDVSLACARAVSALLARHHLEHGQVIAVGCHGQTVWHEPPSPGSASDRPGTSLQLLDASLLAAETGVPVVSDFRSADLAAGGQGAPLVPWPDLVFYSDPHEAQVLVNIGGMANLTWLPPASDTGGQVLAFDTGPGNALMDEAVRLASRGTRFQDTDGAMAGAGSVDHRLLGRLLSDPWLATPPPRSTGRERYGAALVAEVVGEMSTGMAAALAADSGRPGDAREWNDLLATLNAFTVESVAAAIERWVAPRPVHRVVITGGGARNPVLVQGLTRRLAPVPVDGDGDGMAVPPHAREAAAFGLLAWAFMNGVPGNVPSCTGASGPRVLGSWTPAPGRRWPDRLDGGGGA